MSKISTDPARRALNGPTMGTRWSALFFATPGVDPAPIQASLQRAVDEVDVQMSTWRPDSDLMRLNAAPPGTWMEVPRQLATVLRMGLDLGKITGGAFDVGMGDAVAAWGFGPDDAAPDRIRAAMAADRSPAHEVVELDGSSVRKLAPIALDLNGIAKGYGVDRLAAVLAGFGIDNALVGIDGELRAMGCRPDDEGWSIAVEAPDRDRRTPHSVLVLKDAAVATSGDYRHWVEVGDRRLSHTMDPARGAPLVHSPASVAVVARTCAEADAWATAFMVLGVERGAAMARERQLDVLFLWHEDAGSVADLGVGDLFATTAAEASGRLA